MICMCVSLWAWWEVVTAHHQVHNHALHAVTCRLTAVPRVRNQLRAPTFDYEYGYLYLYVYCQCQLSVMPMGCLLPLMTDRRLSQKLHNEFERRQQRAR